MRVTRLNPYEFLVQLNSCSFQCSKRWFFLLLLPPIHPHSMLGPQQNNNTCTNIKVLFNIELGVGGERKKGGVKSSCLPNTFDDMFVVQWSGTCSPCFTLLFYAHHSRTHTNHVNQKIQGFERLQRRCLFAPTLSLRRGGFYVEATAAFQKSK